MPAACPFCSEPVSDAVYHQCGGRHTADADSRVRGPATQARLAPGTAVGRASAPTRDTPYPGLPDPDTDANLSVAHRLHRAFPPAPRAGTGSSSAGGGTDELPAIPDVPGYQIGRVLGRGGMGTVFLARQESLDRPVALKVMTRKWADDPVFLARFTREAFAAAQLNHPNITQIYDIGDLAGTRYFSMEYVPGRSLAEVVRADGRLDPETAVGYILQAARGLAHAHDRGMIHRDIKPDNLLLSEQGVVKVADLGLVKTPDTPAAFDRPAGGPAGHLPANMTGVRMALGTPAYMSPEQCRDAAAVDHRADIYSLGCTLYVLVTGRPPFDADTAVELMTKQAYQPVVPPEEVAARVPKELSAVIQKMMAKQPGERYQAMHDVVRTLEQWLGVHHAGTFNPREDQIAGLEACVRRFNTAPAAVFRERVVTGFLSACLLASVILTVFGRLGWAFGVAGMVLQAAGVYFVLAGLARKTYLFRRVRQFASGMTVGDWLVSFAALGLFGVFLWVLHLFWLWVGFGLIGAGLAVALRFALDRAAELERHAALADAERLLRKLRAHGLGEESLRQFAAKYAGRHWEEFFEAVFGFEAKLAARALLLRGGYAGEREKYAGWREPVVGFIDGVEKARRATRDRNLLVTVEQARLVAAGVKPRAARRRAEQYAAALVRRASNLRSAEAVGGKASNVGTLLAPEPAPAGGYEPSDVTLFVANLWLGPHVRGLLAGILLFGFVTWAYQNGLFAADLPSRLAAGAVEFRTGPLVLPGVPPEYTAWCDSANVGWAGVLLLASLFFRGLRMGVLVLIGAAVAAVGHRFGIRTVEPVQDFHVALMLGTVVSLVGFRFGRR